MSWARLPVELQRAILDEVHEQHKDQQTEKMYARTCKQFFNFMHERRMISVEVPWDRVGAFNRYLSSTDDLLHIRRITLNFSSLSISQLDADEVMSSAAADVLPLGDLLNTLAEVTSSNNKYASHPGIVLRLELGNDNMLSAQAHLAAMLRRVRLATSCRLLPNNIVKVCQVDQNFQCLLGNSVVQNAISSCHGLKILRFSLKHADAYSLRREGESRPPISIDMIAMLTLARESPVTSLILYRNDYYHYAVHPELGRLVVEAACNKEHVSISHVADASDILGKADADAQDKGQDIQKLQWPALRTLVLSAAILAEHNTLEEIQDFLVTASKPTSRMPLLEKLELHQSDFNSVTVFRYTSRPPVLYIGATRPIQGILTPAVVKSWEDSTSRRLTVVEEQLPPNLSRVVAAYHMFAYPMSLRRAVYARHRHASLCKELSTRGSWYTRSPAHHIIDEVSDYEEVHYAKTMTIR